MDEPKKRGRPRKEQSMIKRPVGRPTKAEETDSALRQLQKPPSNFTRLQVIEQDDEKRAFMAKCVANNLYFYNVGRDKVDSNEKLAERLEFFFEKCAETQQLPTVEKMALCLGLSRDMLYQLGNPNRKIFKWVTPETSEMIARAKEILASLDGELAAEGKTQPVVYMFRSKNYYGMRDQVEHIVTPNLPAQSKEELEATAKMLP